MEEQQEKKQRKQRKQRGHGEGSIYQRKDGRWVAQITLEDGKKKQFYGQSRKEVADKLQTALHERKQGMLATGPRQAVKQYLEHWLEKVHRPAIRVGTYLNYRTILDQHILPALGHFQLQRLSAQQIQALYARKQEEGLSTGYIRVMHAMLRKALQNAVRRNLISRNVCDAVTPPRLVKHEANALTPEQARKLLEAVKGQRLEGLLTLALITGMRRGELIGLRWQDIDLVNKSLQVCRTVSYRAGHGFIVSEPKTKKSIRKINLPEFVFEVLRLHRIAQIEARLQAGAKWKEQDLVFCNRYGGFLDPNHLLVRFQRELENAGLAHMRFHDLRHSTATILLSMGVNPKVVQELLGHSSMNMTMNVYSHVFPSMQQEAMGRWDDLFGEGKNERQGR